MSPTDLVTFYDGSPLSKNSATAKVEGPWSEGPTALLRRSPLELGTAPLLP